MENFIYHIPTQIAFGKGQIQRIYDEAIRLMKENNMTYYELSGVEPNPQISTVKKGIEICRKNNIDVLLPIGGGSTIDCAKAIAVGVFFEGDAWDIVKNNDYITKALPIVSVLTVAATGSEMDSSSVISNEELCDKAEINSDLLYPKVSILDPTYTYTVPPYHTAAGVADIMSHIFEYYFNGDTVLDIQRTMMNSILKTCVRYGPIAVKHLDDEKARANLMWAASWAINGFIAGGTVSSWPCHAMEYQLTNQYHVTHGHGMAIIDIAWMEHILNENTLPAFLEYGKEVFGIEGSGLTTAKEIIDKTKEVYESMGLTLTLRSIGAKNKDNLYEMAQQAVEEFGLDSGGSLSLTIEDVKQIYESCF